MTLSGKAVLAETCRYVWWYASVMVHQYNMALYVSAVLCGLDWQAGRVLWTAANQTLHSFSQRRAAAKISCSSIRNVERREEENLSAPGSVMNSFSGKWTHTVYVCVCVHWSVFVTVWHYRAMTFYTGLIKLTLISQMHTVSDIIWVAVSEGHLWSNSCVSIKGTYSDFMACCGCLVKAFRQTCFLFQKSLKALIISIWRIFFNAKPSFCYRT